MLAGKQAIASDLGLSKKPAGVLLPI